MVLWFYGSMVQWFYGSMVQWFNGSMVQWLIYFSAYAEKIYSTIEQ